MSKCDKCRHKNEIIIGPGYCGGCIHNQTYSDNFVEKKLEPVSAEDYMDYIEQLDAAGLSFKEVLDESKTRGFREKRLRYLIRQAAKDGLEQGEQNERLRHEPKVNFIEWWNKHVPSEIFQSVRPDHALFIWNYVNKNRNY